MTPDAQGLKRLGVKKYTSSKVRELTDTEAVLETEGESGPAELRIPCDTVVVCVGSICNRGLYEALAGSMEHVHIIGDAEKIGKVMDAIRQAVAAAARWPWHWLGASGYETAWSVECSSGKYVPERHQSSPAVSFLKKRSAILSKTHTSNALCAFSV